MTIPATMSGVYLTRHGGLDALEWRDDIPVPAPKANQVLVRVLAAGVNNTDINTREGWYSSDVTGATGETQDGIDAGGWAGALQFPRIQGGDICGEVVAIGEKVDSCQLSDRITCPINMPMPRDDAPFAFEALGSEMDGAFAQYCVLPADQVYDVSSSPLSNVEIAAVPCAFGTAAGLLHRAGVTKGTRVFITGASGGVGMAAVQLACAMGAKPMGLSSPAKAQAVREAGAKEIIHRGDPLPRDQFDAVIDLVGGENWQGLLDALKPGGHYAVSGAIGGPMVTGDLRQIYLRDITIHGCTFQSPEVFSNLIDQVNSGQIRPMISKTYPMDQIKTAQTEFMSKTLPGKLVLLPDGQHDDRKEYP